MLAIVLVPEYKQNKQIVTLCLIILIDLLKIQTSKMFNAVCILDQHASHFVYHPVVMVMERGLGMMKPKIDWPHVSVI